MGNNNRKTILGDPKSILEPKRNRIIEEIPQGSPCWKNEEKQVITIYFGLFKISSHVCYQLIPYGPHASYCTNCDE